MPYLKKKKKIIYILKLFKNYLNVHLCKLLSVFCSTARLNDTSEELGSRTTKSSSNNMSLVLKSHREYHRLETLNSKKGQRIDPRVIPLTRS